MNKNTKEYWDKAWSNKGLKKFPKYTLNRVKWLIPDGSSVLDIGCGRGKFLIQLRNEKNCNGFGIDISSVAITQMKKAGIDGTAVSAENLDSFGGKWDVVTALHIFEHVDNDEGFMRNIARFTKDFAIIAVPNDCSYPEETGEHVRKYTVDSLSKLALKYFTSVKNHTRMNRTLLKFHLILQCFK